MRFGRVAIPALVYLACSIETQKVAGSGFQASSKCTVALTTTMSVISEKLVSVLAINARVPGSNTTIDGYFSTSLKAL